MESTSDPFRQTNLAKRFWRHIKQYRNTFFSESLILNTLAIIVLCICDTTIDIYRLDELDASYLLKYIWTSPVAYITLCLPATGFSSFQLYKKSLQKDNVSVTIRGTFFLHICEVLVIVEILGLLFIGLLTITYAIFPDKEASTTPVAYLIFVNGLLYCLKWYQLILFNRFKDHSLFQRGFFPACAALKKPPPRHWILNTNHYRECQDIKHHLYIYAETGDVVELERYITRAILLGGEHFAKEWYKQPKIWFNLAARGGWNPLHIAVARGHLDCVQLLVDSGFCVNQMEKVQRAQIGLSSVYKCVYNFLFFLHGTNHFFRAQGSYGKTSIFVSTLLSPLHIAVANGRLDLTDYLIAKEANVDQVALSNRLQARVPPIFMTTNGDCVDSLVRANANFLSVPGNGYNLTPFQVAVLDDRHCVAAALRRWGADIALTPLHTAVAANDGKTCKKILGTGADPDCLGEFSQGFFHRTPLHWAAIMGRSEMIEILLEYHAKIDVTDSLGMTPLSYAVANFRLQAVQTLLDHGANIYLRNIDGYGLFFLAAQCDGISEDLVMALVTAGLNLNDTGPNGDSPLHIALRYGNKQTAISFVRCGADLMKMNQQGIRALDATNQADLQYAVKTEAGSRDVMISYTHSHFEFAKKIRDAIESSHITTWMDTMDPSGISGGSIWRAEITKGIMNSTVLLSILSKDYPSSPWCLKELALAKQLGVPVFAISCEDFPLTDELKIYLFTRQIITFQESIKGLDPNSTSSRKVSFIYNEERFQERLNLLLDGLRNEIAIEKLSRSSQEIQSPSSDVRSCHSIQCATTVITTTTTTASPLSPLVCIFHGDQHNSFANRLHRYLAMHNLPSFVDSYSICLNASDRMKVAKEAILHSRVFVVILSSRSIIEESLNDYLGFAEDHGKEIIPILYSKPAIDLAKMYSLSRTESWHHFAQDIGFDESASLLMKRLVSIDGLKLENEGDGLLDRGHHSNS